MDWEVHVSGPQSILDELVYAFDDGDITLTRVGDQFVLRSRTLQNLADSAAVRSEAERIVEALSGISRVLLQSDRPLNVASLAEVRADGTRNIFVQVEPAVLRVGAGLVSVVVTHSDGRIEEHRPSDPAPIWLGRALSDAATARALRLRDAGHLSWTDLYRLYEVIEAGAGGADGILAKDWISRSQLRRFKHSANSVSAAGDQARHGVETTQPPADAMTLSEARSLIDILLGRWLGSGAV